MSADPTVIGAGVRRPALRCCATIVCALLTACARAQSQMPDETLHAFYSWVLAHPSRGLPSPSERAELSRVLAPALVETIRRASEMEAKCVAAAPKGDKPLLIEGDLFVGNYEGATEVAYGKPLRKGDSVMIESDLLYVDNRFPKAHKHRAVAWKDRVEIRLVGGRFHVVNVHFAHGRTLVAALEAYVVEGMRSCIAPDAPKR